MDIYLNQKRIKLNPKNAIGKGGEADIYDLKNGRPKTICCSSCQQSV